MRSRRSLSISTALAALVFSGALPTDADELPNTSANVPAQDSRKIIPEQSVEELGKALFERNCTTCHGFGGTGGRGPNLTRPRLARAPDDASLRNLIKSGIPPEMPSGYFFEDADVAALASYVRSVGKVTKQQVAGNSSRGAKIFARSGCPACHIFEGKGIGFGPELTDLGIRRSSEYVHREILEPASSLPADFLMVRVITSAGQEIQGARVNEDTFSIQIKDPSGRFFSFRKSQLKQLEKLKGETPMPSFEGVLSSSELQDVVAYLLSPSDDS
jgi:putative heme-binding domain-containing protein